MTDDRPLISVGIPVFNEELEIASTVTSVLEQDLNDLEVVVSDNASTDATAAILHRIRDQEPRLRIMTSARNVGLLANYNRSFHLSRGRYFRWLGAGDRLLPGCLTATVELLESEPDSVVATSPSEFRLPDGSRTPAGTQTGPDEASALERLRRMLELLGRGHGTIDPMYSLIRRSALERTPVLRPTRMGDQVLAVELSLLGRYVHRAGPPLLERAHPVFASREQARRIFPLNLREGYLPLSSFRRDLHRLIATTDTLSAAECEEAHRLVERHYLRRHRDLQQRRLTRVRSRLGADRAG